jgi:DDE superfamily endonuclease
MTLPASWRMLLETLRPVFGRSSTFGLFALLATGLVARTARRTVVGMLAGAGMAALVSFHSACRFFSHHAWDTDRLGLTVAALIVQRLLPADASITVVVDDTLFRRWGKKVDHAFWTHDGAAQGPAKLGRGNRWVIAGIVVRLPFCSHPVCLPILFRLWAGKGTASPVELAGAMLAVLAKAFPQADPRCRRRRLPRRTAAGGGYHDHHPAARQRRPVRPGAATHRPARTARQERAAATPAGRVGRHRDLAHRHHASLRAPRYRRGRRHRRPLVKPVGRSARGCPTGGAHCRSRRSPHRHVVADRARTAGGRRGRRH